jgi:hypothetical protein
MSAFYERLGWTLRERQVGRHGLDVFFRDADASADHINSPP